MYPIELVPTAILGGVFIAASAIEDVRNNRLIPVQRIWAYLFFSLVSLAVYFQSMPTSSGWIGAASLLAMIVLALHATGNMGEADALCMVGLLGYFPQQAIMGVFSAFAAGGLYSAYLLVKREKMGKRVAFLPFIALGYLVACLLSVVL